MSNLIKEVALYIIDGHTIEEASKHFSKSVSSIKKYLAKVRDTNASDYDANLAEKLKLAQEKIILKGVKKGGSLGKRTRNLRENEAKMYADAYMSGLTIEQLANLSQIPKSTLHETIRSIDDKEIQERLDDYVRRG